MGDVGELIWQVSYGWRGEATTALDGGLSDVPRLLGEDGDATGCREPRSVGAGDGCPTVWQFVFRNEDMRWEGCDSVR